MNFLSLLSGYCSDGSMFYLEVSDETPAGDALKCDVCGNFYGAVPTLPPVKGTLIAERSVFDFSGSAGDEVLLSERCLRTFEVNGVGGLIDPNPIELIAVDGPFDLSAVGNYFLAGVAHWGAEVDRLKSGMRTTEQAVCPSCGYAGLIEGFDRICVIESSWQGQDLFTLKGLPGAIMATERLLRVCHEANLSVCGLIPSEHRRMPMVDTHPGGRRISSN